MSKSSYQNYINLKYYNYLRYEDKPELVFAQTRQRLQNQFKTKKINYSDKMEIETRLNYFYDAVGGNYSTSSWLDQDGFQALVEGTYDYVRSEEGKPNIAINAGLQGGISKYNVNNVINKIERIDNTTKIKISTVDAHIQKLEYMRQQISKDPQHDMSLLNELNLLITQWNQIKTLINKAGNQYISIKEYGGFFAEYNRLVNDLFKYDKNLSGIVGEAVTAGIMYLSEQTAKKTSRITKEEVSKALQKTVVGKKMSVKGFNASTLLTPMLNKNDLRETFGDKNIKNINYQGEYVNVVMNANDIDPKGTQDKVDIIFSFKNQLLRASVKNYNLNNPYGQKYGIHIVSGTNPFVLLNNDAKFLQHYFNVTSDHGYFNSNKQWHGAINTQLEAPSRTIAEAHQLAKQVMFANALVGGQLSHNVLANVFKPTEQANLFIINDTSSRRYRVYFVQELIDKVLNNFTMIKMVHGYPEDALFKYDITGWEQMSHSGKERMMKIYSQMNKFKIDISLDFAAITNSGLENLI